MLAARLGAAALLIGGAVLVPTTAQAATASSVTPMSATGCTGNPGSNGSKCISVKGTKLHVDTVKTTLTRNHANNCGVAHIQIGSWKKNSGRICKIRDFSWGPIKVNKSFPNNTKACAWWSNYPNGKACINIHK